MFAPVLCNWSRNVVYCYHKETARWLILSLGKRFGAEQWRQWLRLPLVCGAGVLVGGVFNDKSFVVNLLTKDFKCLPARSMRSRERGETLACHMILDRPEERYYIIVLSKNVGERRSPFAAAIELYDSKLNLWTKVDISDGLPSPFSYLTSTCLGNKFYVIVRLGSEMRSPIRVASYDIKEQKWSIFLYPLNTRTLYIWKYKLLTCSEDIILVTWEDNDSWLMRSYRTKAGTIKIYKLDRGSVQPWHVGPPETIDIPMKEACSGIDSIYFGDTSGDIVLNQSNFFRQFNLKTQAWSTILRPNAAYMTGSTVQWSTSPLQLGSSEFKGL